MMPVRGPRGHRARATAHSTYVWRHTVGTCEAEGAQKSNVVKGATWRLCDKNNPNNFDKPPIADGNDCNDAKCEREPPTKKG